MTGSSTAAAPPSPASPKDGASGAPRSGDEAAKRREVDDRILFQEELSWKQLDELDRDRTVFFVTVSPLHQHGPHLPIGVDCFTAQAFAAAAARRLCTEHPNWKAVLAPILPIGADTFEYLGSISIRRRAVRDLLEDFLDSIARYDFPNIVVVHAHGGPGHAMALSEACARVNDRRGARAFSPMTRILPDLFGGHYRDTFRKVMGDSAGADLDLTSDHHAGRWETSMLLYLRPELVDSGYTRLKPIEVDAQELNAEAAQNYGDRLGYFGAPAQADREIGRVSTALIGREIVDMFFRVETDPDFLADFAPPSVFSPSVVYRIDFSLWVLATLLVLLALLPWFL